MRLRREKGRGGEKGGRRLLDALKENGRGSDQTSIKEELSGQSVRAIERETLLEKEGGFIPRSCPSSLSPPGGSGSCFSLRDSPFLGPRGSLYPASGPFRAGTIHSRELNFAATLVSWTRLGYSPPSLRLCWKRLCYFALSSTHLYAVAT